MNDGLSDETSMNERQARIVARVEEQGFVTIDALARDFAVSTQTIRREIIRLDELGVIQRFHGGAGRRGSGERLSYEVKQSRETELKRRVGVAMAARVKPGQSIFLDVGTTAEATAAALASVGPLRIVTPGATIARILSASPAIEVVLTGGRMVGPDISMAGPIALRTVSAFRFDWAIIACSGIEPGGAVLDFDADKIALKQCAMEVSERSALITDSTKFGRSALVEMTTLSAFDLIVTDAPPPSSFADAIGGAAIEVASDV